MCTIFIDMDNVTADLNRYVVEEVNAREGTNHKPEDTTDWWWSNLGVPQEYLNGILCEPYAFEFLEPVNGAIEGINKLKEFPEDMRVVDFAYSDLDNIYKRVWIHSNYPYNKPDEEVLMIC